MTRQEMLDRRDELIRKRNALVDRMAADDCASETIASGGGSHSRTNRDPVALRKKIAFVEREIAQLSCALGEGPDPSSSKTVYVNFR